MDLNQCKSRISVALHHARLLLRSISFLAILLGDPPGLKIASPLVIVLGTSPKR